MKHYTLQADEVLLFENDITIKGNNATHYLLLTNHNIVIISTSKKLFKKEEVSVAIYPVSEIKTYNDTPQVKQKNCDITVFFISGELEFSLISFKKATIFVNKIIELLTGKTISKRGSDKVKGAIGLVDDTLGINTMGTVTGIIENGIGGTLLKGIGHKSKKSKVASTADKIATAANATTAVMQAVNTPNNQEALPTTQEQKSNEMSYDQQIEAVKKLKELLDMGIITQEEFDIKKKELLKL